MEEPATLKLSSTVTVPPAESKVRFPVEVSISLEPEIPILILLIEVPDKVVDPQTLRLFPIPTPPATTRAPVVQF